MDLKIIYLILYILSTLTLFASIVYLAKYRRFQSSKAIDGVNTYIFGLIFLFIYFSIQSLNFGIFIIEKIMPSYYNLFSQYINYLNLISGLFIVLMIAVCFLISVIILKEEYT